MTSSGRGCQVFLEFAADVKAAADHLYYNEVLFAVTTGCDGNEGWGLEVYPPFI